MRRGAGWGHCVLGDTWAREYRHDVPLRLAVDDVPARALALWRSAGGRDGRHPRRE